MIRREYAKVAPSVVLAATLLVVGCWHRRKDAPAQPAASAVQEIVPAAVGVPASAMPVAPTMMEGSAEPYVDLEMVDAPVKLVLQRLAEIGGLQLIIPPNLNKTISVQYVKVPVSIALNDVLRRSGLRLGAGPVANLPFDTVTVFYKLPANVDSMSVEAIMRRFGVTRTIAELIVKSRKP